MSQQTKAMLNRLRAKVGIVVIAATAVFGLVDVRADKGCCGNSDCSVLDNYLVPCGSCHPNYPTCCEAGDLCG